MRNLLELKTASVAVKILLALVMAMYLAACSDSDDDDDDDMQAMAMFEVMVINASNGQPLTPVAVIAHTPGYTPWTLGASASTGLEMLAEGGDVSQFISDANSNANVVATASSGVDAFGPGSSKTVTIETEPNANLQISLASMLANTNDAFTGIANYTVGSMMVGESVALMPNVYDAGTEDNSETAGTMPGPAGGGVGFDVDRGGDTDFISVHAGVVTSDDGLATSALNESHRWLGPVSVVIISRTN